MRVRSILIVAVLVALGFGVGRLSAALGTVDSPSAPGATDSFTVEDIYNRLDTGAAGAQSTFTEPAAGPGTGTMHTLNQIMAKAPAIDNTNGATETNVLDGKTFWGLTAGQWGRQTGTMPDRGAVTIVPTTTQQTIALGYHNGSGYVEGDADLVADKIKEGVDIFGVAGELHGGCTCTGTLNGTRWCDNGDGTVTDLTTCLVWLQNANCTDTLAGISKSTGYLKWDDAVVWSSVVISGTCGLTDSSVEGDWWLPTKTQLYVLTHGTEPVRSGTPRAFTGVQSYSYWSSTTYANSPARAWYVTLLDGYVYYVIKDFTTYVWPVRGGQ